VFVAYANACGSEGNLTYNGGSVVFGPGGDALARADDGPALLSATLSATSRAPGASGTPLPDRRSDLYGALADRQR
jgi:5-aminopentanamidase